MIKIKSIILIVILILIVMNSCIEEDENPAKAEGYVIDIITHERLGNTEIRILEWRESWFSGSGDPYSIIKETGYTDTDGHFLVKYFSNPKYEYTLGIFRELYFEEDRFTLPLQYNFVKLGIFPKGFIKTHVTNRIDTARFIEFFYTPYFNSQEVYRYGFENCNILTAAFTDTTFITTTVGGVTNNLKILYYYCDSTLDNIVAKDTSFSTRIHDTVHLNINLY